METKLDRPKRKSSKTRGRARPWMVPVRAQAQSDETSNDRRLGSSHRSRLRPGKVVFIGMGCPWRPMELLLPILLLALRPPMDLLWIVLASPPG
eukprot:scaffold27211_cov63-Phaeocystis_antarctica.AAC.3